MDVDFRYRQRVGQGGSRDEKKIGGFGGELRLDGEEVGDMHNEKEQGHETLFPTRPTEMSSGTEQSKRSKHSESRQLMR